MSSPIRLAIIGAGLFAQEAHLPALLALGDTFEIVAVHSRTRAKAAALAAQVSPPAAAYDDLDALLAQNDIEAVDLVLPIQIMPGVLKQALAAGKHVISEKPAAPDVATGRDLLAFYAKYPDQVWMVAENWRYEAAPLRAAEIVQSGEIGQPLVCHWALHNDMSPSNRYYHTPWRRESAFPGGYLLDGGVHHIAGLRLILGEIAEVSAVVKQIRPDLPPADTLSAALVFDSGVTGVYGVTYAHESPWPPMLHIVGDAGTLRVQPGEIEITTASSVCRTERSDRTGVEHELAAFAAAIREGTPHRNSPEQGIQDVAVIEAILRSSETGRREKVAQIG
jgi:predicted dehydrogenase